MVHFYVLPMAICTGSVSMLFWWSAGVVVVVMVHSGQRCNIYIIIMINVIMCNIYRKTIQ